MTRLSNGAVTNITNLTTTSCTPPTDLAPGTNRIWVRTVSASNRFSAQSIPIDLTIVQTEDTQNADDATLAVQIISRVFSEFALSGDLADGISSGSRQRTEVLTNNTVAVNAQQEPTPDAAVETGDRPSLPQPSVVFATTEFSLPENPDISPVWPVPDAGTIPGLQDLVAAVDADELISALSDQRIP